MASEVNSGLWPLLMDLLEYFQNPSQNIQNDAIPMPFGPLGAVLALDHYFIDLMISGLLPLAETFDSPYHASNMYVCVLGVPQN